jgi:HK97 family phage major capsid protein
MKHVKQTAEHDCGVATIAMLVDAPYWRANAASGYDDYPHTIIPSEMVKLLRKFTGQPWELHRGEGLPISEFALPAGERAAVAIVCGEGKDKRGHWVAWEDGTVYCPTHDGPIAPQDLGQDWIVHSVARAANKPTSAREGAKVKITPQLKSFLRQEHGLSASASDGKARELVLAKMASGELDAETVVSKSMDEAKSEKILDNIAARLMERAEQKLNDQGGSDTMDITKKERDDAVTPHSLLMGGKKAKTFRRGSLSVSYEKESDIGLHVKSGKPVTGRFGEPVVKSSRFVESTLGWLLKKQAHRQGIEAPMDADEIQFGESLMADEKWVGVYMKQFRDGTNHLSQMEVKSILDDTTSGGSYATPEWLDTAVVNELLLHSELLPHVSVVDAPRGSVMEGVTIGAMQDAPVWGTMDGTGGNPYVTDDLLNQFTDEVKPVRTIVKFGRDVMADSSINLGAQVLSQLSMSMSAEMDRVIAIGTGDEPSGVFSASGLTSVLFANPVTGPITLGDLESMHFAVGKQYRGPGCCWISSDQGYARVKGMAVGSDNALRILGENYAAYTAMGYPWRVQNDIPDGHFIFGNLTRGYRMWRRGGWETRWIDSGLSLASSNEIALIIRGRWAAKVVQSSCFSKSTTGPVQS